MRGRCTAYPAALAAVHFGCQRGGSGLHFSGPHAVPSHSNYAEDLCWHRNRKLNVRRVIGDFCIAMAIVVPLFSRMRTDWRRGSIALWLPVVPGHNGEVIT